MMQLSIELKQKLQKAIEAFPYAVNPTDTEGAFEADDDKSVQYVEGISFPVGDFFGEKLMGYGTVYLRGFEDDENVEITGIFITELDNRPDETVPQGDPIQGWYNPQANHWEFDNISLY